MYPSPKPEAKETILLNKPVHPFRLTLNSFHENNLVDVSALICGWFMPIPGTDFSKWTHKNCSRSNEWREVFGLFGQYADPVTIAN